MLSENEDIIRNLKLIDSECDTYKNEKYESDVYDNEYYKVNKLIKCNL